ncbi:MAG: mechanosensitive ion channel [Saprospiraceae bacterium]|nr:mechanosensitive ion channel [Saprospiraceae bacterium]MCF8251173.1 mechanosensitive ion channel [Saprospiraceae bacterium]MCF8281896.1 mechanosensitive ion channel [Bacteroidales bacterium]MCF8312985.1 mechanosensitive ion channel [Saprospiraceae bacterium]MCF8441432.1 mechanosensitive ion channel [Saprospiraceae bacterium]
MNEITTWTEVFFHSFQSFGQKLLGTIPGILGAIIILLLGWLFAKFVAKGVARLLKLIKFDKLADKIKATDFLKKANVERSPSEVIGVFVYWILLLLVIISASDALGWAAVSGEVSKLLSLLPNVLVGIVFFVIGYYIASFVRDVIRGAASSMNIGAGKLISSFVFYLLLILITLTALNQAGVDTSIITGNLMLILGAILGAAAISYGFASKDVLSNILAGFFSRRTFSIGQTIEIEGVRGKIVSVSNISVILQTSENEQVVVPAHQLITNRVKIIG